MANKRDYYEVLGLNREAPPDEVDKAYRRLAKQFHPDRNSGDGEAMEKFKEAAEAYEVLRDPDKRQRYDRYGFAGLEGMAMPDFGNADVLSSMFGDIFDSLFGGGGRGRRGGPKGGRDVRVEIELELAEAASGVTKQLRFRREDVCSACRGSGGTEKSKRRDCQTCAGHGAVLQGGGFFAVQRTCPTCKGRGSQLSDPCKECQGNGRVPREGTVPVEIPAGIDSNMEFIVEGEGDAGDQKDPRGDLRVLVTVREHQFFKRHGDDLICQAVITFPQAALGCEIEIPTVDGKRITHVLPRGTQSHEVITIPGQGMPSVHDRHRRDRRRGSLLVQIVVETPRSLSKRQEELLRELADADDKNVQPQRRGWLDKVKSFFTDGSAK